MGSIRDDRLSYRPEIVRAKSGRDSSEGAEWKPPRHNNGFVKQYTFANGYIVSIIWDAGSYGNRDCLFEAAIINPYGDFEYDAIEEGHPDVYGWVDFQQVVAIIDRVAELPDPRKVKVNLLALEEQLSVAERVTCINTIGGSDGEEGEPPAIP